MTTAPESLDQETALDILTRLKQGVPPEPKDVPYIRVDRESEIDRLCKKPTEGLQSVRRGSGQIFFVLGDFGYGKSFFINLLAYRAQDMNMMSSVFDIQDVHDISDKGELYTKIVQNLRYPDQRGEGVVPLLREFIEEMDHADLERIASRHNFFGHPVYKMLDQLLTAESQGSVYVEQDGVRLNTREVLQAVAGYLRGEDVGLEGLHAIGKKGFANVSKENQYDYLRHIRSLAIEVDYSGIVVLIDEAAERLEWSPDSETTQRLIDLYNKCYQSEQFNNMMFVFVGNQERWDSLIEETGHQALDDRYQVKRLVLSELERGDYVQLVTRIADLVEIGEGRELSFDERDARRIVEDALEVHGGVASLSPRDLLIFPDGKDDSETLVEKIQQL